MSNERITAERIASLPERSTDQPLWTLVALRDNFAMAALTGLLGNIPYGMPVENEVAARDCYRLADAMMAEREKVKP